MTDTLVGPASALTRNLAYLISPSRHARQAVRRHLIGSPRRMTLAFASVQEKTPEPASVPPLNKENPVGSTGDYR